MNFLILSVGTRNKIVQYFKRTFEGIGNIVVTDMSELAPAIYEADKFYIVPSVDDKNYLDVIVNICREENICGITSLIDTELSLISQNKDLFSSIGVTVIGSSYELCNRALDKMDMYNWLKSHNYNCARSYVKLEDFYKDLEERIVDFPVFVKPVKGSASISISKVYDKNTLETVFDNNSNLMIQEFLDGQEIGADCYIDLISKETVSVFTKKKLKMRAGETDKSVSFKDEKLFDLIKKFNKESGWLGQIDIDIFDVDGKYYISEVNPRFGGGYPHAFECGVNHIKLIINNLKGLANESIVGDYAENKYMMKYNEIKII